MPPWFSPLFFLFARSSEEQLRRQILFLKAELELTRGRVPQSRLFLSNEERQRLLELDDDIGSDALKLVSIVHPRTCRRWMERRSNGKPPAKKMGRKGTSETIRQIVVRLAKQTQWGYARIIGELRKLRIRCVGHLIRDNDGCYSRELDRVFELAGVAVEPTAPRSPNQNAYIERWIGSLKSECLDRFWVFGLDHLDHIGLEFVRYYNELRPHQRKDIRPLLGVWSEDDRPLSVDERIACRTRLGGVLKHYRCVAA